MKGFFHKKHDFFYRNLGFFYRNIEFFYRNIGFFYKNIEFFYKNIGFFYRNIEVFYRNNEFFYCLRIPFRPSPRRSLFIYSKSWDYKIRLRLTGLATLFADATLNCFWVRNPPGRPAVLN